jgi:hypothetical protein
LGSISHAFSTAALQEEYALHASFADNTASLARRFAKSILFRSVVTREALFPLFFADPPDVKRFAQVVLCQCSYGRASANIGGQNPLTSDVIYHKEDDDCSVKNLVAHPVGDTTIEGA